MDRAPERSSSLTRSAFVARWIAANGMAELLGIGLAAATIVALVSLFGEPETWTARLTVYAATIAVGAVEGALLGLAQATLLRHRLPALSVRRYVTLTVLVAAGAWALGMAPSTFMTFDSGGEPPAEPSWVFVLTIAAAGGAFGGLLFGLAQRLELRRHGVSSARWIGASALGWALALPLDFVGASLPSETTPAALVVLSGLGFGLLAGAVFGLPTAFVAWRLPAQSSTPQRTPS